MKLGELVNLESVVSPGGLILCPFFSTFNCNIFTRFLANIMLLYELKSLECHFKKLWKRSVEKIVKLVLWNVGLDFNSLDIQNSASLGRYTTKKVALTLWSNFRKFVQEIWSIFTPVNQWSLNQLYQNVLNSFCHF